MPSLGAASSPRLASSGSIVLMSDTSSEQSEDAIRIEQEEGTLMRAPTDINR